jgi:hypothetical protein
MEYRIQATQEIQAARVSVKTGVQTGKTADPFL